MFYFNGKNYNIPGVYGIIKVILLSGGTLPNFNIGLIMGKNFKGTSYNATNPLTGAALGADQLITPYGDAVALARDYGTGDIYNAFKKAQEVGAGAQFVLGASPNTPIVFSLPDVTPAACLQLKANPMFAGVFGKDMTVSNVEAASLTRASTGGGNTGTATSATNTTLVNSGEAWTVDGLIGKWIRITGGTGRGQTRKITDNDGTSVTVATWTTNPDTTSTYEIVEAQFTLTFTPTKDEKMLVANTTSGQNVIYVNSLEGVAEGRTFILASSNTRESVQVQSYDETYASNGGFKVVLVGNLANNHTTANSARLFNKDTSRQEVYTFVGSDWNIANVVNTINKAAGIFSAAGQTALTPEPMAESYCGAVSGAAGGTNLDAASADYSAIAANFPNWSNKFLQANKVNIRVIHPATPDASIHAILKAIMPAMRDKNRPFVMVVGADSGDVLTTGSANTNPTYRAFNLNSGAIQLCAPGVNGLPAWKSLAPYAFGIRLANPIIHNQTRDLVPVYKMEKEWTDVELDKIVKGGVWTVQPMADGYRAVVGINTYQDQTTEWNAQDNDTYLTMQKDLGDFCDIGIKERLDKIVGTDGVTEQTVATAANATAAQLIADGYCTDYKLKYLKKDGVGWRIRQEFKLPGETNFFGVESYIIVGGNA